MHPRHCRSIRALIVAFVTHINDKDYFHIKETNAIIKVKTVKAIKQVRYYLCIYYLGLKNLRAVRFLPIM